MDKKPQGKFPLSPLVESWAEQQFLDCNVFYVDSAVWIAAGISPCSRNRLLEAVRVGSLHAHNFSGYFGNDGRNTEMNYGGRGSAKRLAFHVNTLQSWATDDAKITAAHRQQNAARLNVRCTTSYGSGSAIL